MIVVIAEYLVFAQHQLCNCHVTAQRREEATVWLPHIADSEESACASCLLKVVFFLNTRFNSVLLELEFRCERELRCMNCLYRWSISLQSTEKDKASLVFPPWVIIDWRFFPLLVLTTLTAMSKWTSQMVAGAIETTVVLIQWCIHLTWDICGLRGQFYLS